MKFRVIQTNSMGFVLQNKKYFWNKWFTYSIGYLVEESAIHHLEQEVARYESEKNIFIRVVKEVKV